MAEGAAHSAYLVFLAFGENDGEFLVAPDFYGAWFGGVAADVDAALHFFFETFRQRGGTEHLVFFFVRMVGV